ncbi:hypothetical protein TNCV_277071 [Trichonephila clavipes]|uniref:Uncharacterized protein n=1 Tax=Trichonephila clavipes TaxID=2585209 RepID=A0A8X6VIE7_TRICX|nr:hypothetical protein TNCV_277071 [Trichonephila clavipes]
MKSWQRWDSNPRLGETGALNQRLRPLGHATVGIMFIVFFYSFGTFIVKCIKKLFGETKKRKPGSGGIRNHVFGKTGALNLRLTPLGHATVGVTFIVFFYSFGTMFLNALQHFGETKNEILAAVGFEPTPPERLVP